MGASRDWKVVLSPGEQQRVAFARLLRSLGEAPPNSSLAVLDEATSAMDVELERKLYKEFRQELEPGAGLRGFVSVAHRPTLRAFHQSLLIIGDVSPEEEGSLGMEPEPLVEGMWSTPDGDVVPWRHLRMVRTSYA